MEGHRKLDVAGRAAADNALILRDTNARLARFLVLFVCSCLPLLYCPTIPGQATASDLQQWMASGQWQTIVDFLRPVAQRTAEMEFDYGTALAHLRRWSEAVAAFHAGERLAPHDARFPTELAGIAFEQKKYPLAARYLRRAQNLGSNDSYINNFLATVYFLEGNLPGAIQYWNRMDKPYLAAVREEPAPSVSASLLDSAFTFSPATTLTLRQYLDSQERVSALGIFPQYHINLRALPDGRFDIVFRGRERNGFGDTISETLFLLFRGLPFQEVNPEYLNARHETINFVSAMRWDAQKRMASAQLSGPLHHHSARLRYELLTRLTNENWIVRRSFTGTAPPLASFNLRHEQIAVGFADYARDRVQWRIGGELSHRDYRNVSAADVLSQSTLATGYQLKQQTDVAANLWYAPALRFTVHGGASYDVGRIWSSNPQTFAKLQAGVGWRWLPQAKGDDYETVNLLRVGRTFGQAPFDELFMLGLDRDTNLPMHAHISTRDGRKGSAPVGRRYLLANWETNKNLYGNGIISAQIGPVIDLGTISDPGTSLGSSEWLFDAGVQAKVRVFGKGLAFSWGHDLRRDNNALYVSILRKIW
jgi:tetratricopeptide (TPR) repeat protein